MKTLSCFSLALLLCLACMGVPRGIICTTVFVSGLNITVTDEEGEPVPGAVVTITDGEFTETLEELGGAQPGEFIGAGERAGTYSITIEAEGFVSQTIEDVVVNENMCHVIPVALTVVLAAP